ncbi:MAG: ferric uptake regulator, Fur family [Frankiales bacterium]|nr:ferric uptake regulator, Fur family [Frankiales bacterium]
MAKRLPTAPAGTTAARSTAVRSTRQAAAVEAALASAAGFRSAQDLYADLRSQGQAVGLTTVYRHLTQLTEAGVLDVLHNGDGEVVYRLCADNGHHHHLVCRGCGATVEVDGPEVESWAAKVAEKAGFTDVSHTVEVFGTCRGCAT